MKNTLAIVSIIGALTLALTGCSAGDESEPIDEPKESAPAEVVEESTDPDGSRDRPYVAGTQAPLADVSSWIIGFQPSNLNATDVVLAENPYNETLEGHTPVIAPVNIEVREAGGQDLSGGADVWASLTFEFVSEAGRSYGASGNTYCGVIPNDIAEIGTLYVGATASGNACAQVPTEEIAGGLWAVSNGAGDKMFFTIE